MFVELLEHSPGLPGLGDGVLLDGAVKVAVDGAALRPLDHLALHRELVPLGGGRAGEHAQGLGSDGGDLELVFLENRTIKLHKGLTITRASCFLTTSFVYKQEVIKALIIQIIVDFGRFIRINQDG